MDYEPRFTERAINDIRVYHDRIAEYSPERAEKWRRKLLAKVDTLRRLPSRCPLAPEGERFGEHVRELLHGKRTSCYRILYVVRDDVVLILAVWRASRGPADL